MLYRYKNVCAKVPLVKKKCRKSCKPLPQLLIWDTKNSFNFVVLIFWKLAEVVKSYIYRAKVAGKLYLQKVTLTLESCKNVAIVTSVRVIL